MRGRADEVKQNHRTVLNNANEIPLEALNVALRMVVTPEYMREQTVSTVNQFFDFIEGRSGNAEIALNITFVKGDCW